MKAVVGSVDLHLVFTRFNADAGEAFVACLLCYIALMTANAFVFVEAVLYLLCFTSVGGGCEIDIDLLLDCGICSRW